MIRPVVLLVGILWAVSTSWAAPPPDVTGAHSELSCEDCHEQRDDTYLTFDCDTCHPDSTNIHPVGMVPRISVPEEFQLGRDGTLLCRSCHQLHGGNPLDGFLATPDGGLDRTAFCAKCHGARMRRTNPHQARQGTDRCAYCHASLPEEGTAASETIRLDIIKLCDFCHDAVTKNHPRNIDPSLSFPKGLPLSPDGDWTCITCHNPHGTTTTTHYVRAEFAQHFERGRQANPHVDSYFACKACHTVSVSDEIRPPDYALRYKGDINVMCISCHVTDKGHHPTGLPLPPMMQLDMEASGKTLPFDDEGRMTCYTCHDNSCDTGEQEMRQRHYDRERLVSDLCWICHVREDFAKVNPHVDDQRQCVQCHESMPIPGLSRGLMAIPKMVCLRCHNVKPHPASADHLQTPSARIDPDPSLPLGPGGEVSCVTCHDPHAMPEPVPEHRLRQDGAELCGLCHWKS